MSNHMDNPTSRPNQEPPTNEQPALTVEQQLEQEIARRKAAEAKNGQLLQHVSDQQTYLKELSVQIKQFTEPAKNNQNESALLVPLAKTVAQLMSFMNHDFKTPLSSILGYSQFLLKIDKDLTNRQSDDISTIYRCGQDLFRMIDNILEWCRFQVDETEVYQAEFDLSKLLQKLIKRSEAQAKDTHSNFQHRFSTDLPQTGRGDELKLNLVLINLLDNALKNTYQGDVTFTIEPVEADIEPSDLSHNIVRLRFLVEDTGRGIPADRLEGLFEPSPGLGLAVSSRLLQTVGETIQFESKEGEGSRFWFEMDL
ncbi:HAMP domain-containing sensor histidine kinase [Anaerolineales bacterium HSG25]|nr:HAMP domain-containing sensor histidine kinase [Anaerolineales bacterium HSG25]